VIRVRLNACARHALLGTVLLGFSAAIAAPTIGLAGGTWVRTIGAGQLQAGAGSDFNSPVDVDVPIATLAVSDTNGGGWTVKVARIGSDWPSGVNVAIRLSGGSDERDIQDGKSYRPLTCDLQPLFRGSGDYSNIQILLRLDGVTVDTVPGAYTVAIRYEIEATG